MPEVLRAEVLIDEKLREIVEHFLFLDGSSSLARELFVSLRNSAANFSI